MPSGGGVPRSICDRCTPQLCLPDIKLNYIRLIPLLFNPGDSLTLAFFCFSHFHASSLLY